MDELKPILQYEIPGKVVVCHCLDVRVFSCTMLDHRLTLKEIHSLLGDVLHKPHDPVQPSKSNITLKLEIFDLKGKI